MTIEQYQIAAKQYDKSDGTPAYYAMGLAGETGETVEIIKKSTRKGIYEIPINKEKLTLEMGDVLWYLTQMAAYYDISMRDIMVSNLHKLEMRRLRMEAEREDFLVGQLAG